jgi:hypothetical protein
MKQRIEVEQLLELTGEQKERLRELWEPQKGDWYYYIKIKHSSIIHDSDSMSIGLYKNHKEDYLPLLSIGQMIELLEEKKMVTESLDIKAPKGLINIYSVWYGNGDFPKKYESKELCDALWQAVKEVL